MIERSDISMSIGEKSASDVDELDQRSFSGLGEREEATHLMRAKSCIMNL